MAGQEDDESRMGSRRSTPHHYSPEPKRSQSWYAPGELEGRQYNALSQMGLPVRGQVDRCEAAFKNKYTFTRLNGVVGVLADAIAVIAKKQ